MKKAERPRRTKRELLFSVFRRKFELLEAVNVNVDFIKMQRLFCSNTPSFRNRFDLHRFIALQEVGGEPVDYLEFGVWEGNSLRFWTELSKNPKSRFFGFDTFTGLPETWTRDSPAGTFSTNGILPDVEDTRATLIKGLFQNTLALFLQNTELQHRLVVHVDCDLYSSTLFVLASMNNHLKPGSIIIFDDFYSLLHEFRAFLDYDRSFFRSWKPLAHVDHCVQTAIRVEK